MPRKKMAKRTYEFTNRDIIAGLILAFTARPRPTDEELNNDAEKIQLWDTLYRISEKLQAIGWSTEMPLQWLQQEFPNIQWINPGNPNAIYPQSVLDLFTALQEAGPVIASASITDDELMPEINPMH